MKDIVLGIDASTTAVKAIAFDRKGCELFQAREPYPLSSPAPGFYEQEAEDWWSALAKALKHLTASLDPARIAALSIAHQRETFVFANEKGWPLGPGILWLDERSRAQVSRLSAWLGRDRIRDWSGKPPDPTPALYGIAWLAEHRPEIVRDAFVLLDVHGFLMRRLTGRFVTSTASADPLGIFSPQDGTWRPELVEAASLRPDQLPELAAPGEICGEISAGAAQSTGLLEGTPVVAGAGDGQAMGLGMGVVSARKAYVSLGSGVVGGAYSAEYRSSDAFRTLVSPTGEGFMLETVLRSGMQLVDWVLRLTGGSSAAALEEAATKVAPGSDGLLLLPYWAGVMSPYWDEAARGAILGLSLNHGPPHLLRAALEGIAFEQSLATEALEASAGQRPEEMIVAGGGTNSALLMTILSTILGRELSISPVNEAAALGAAMLAATAAGWSPAPSAAAEAMATKPSRRVEPDEGLVGAYLQRKEIYRSLYHATKDIHGKLAALPQGSG